MTKNLPALPAFSRFPALLFRPEDHNILIPLLLRWLIDLRGISKAENELLKLIDSELLITELPTSKRHRYLHHVSLCEEFAALIRQSIEVANISAETETNHLHLGLLAMRLLLFLFFLEPVEIAAEISDLYNRRNGFWRHFNKVVSLLLCSRERHCGGKLFRGSILSNKEHLEHADLFIDAWFVDLEDGTRIALSQRKRGKE